jgi:hypothetical protein
MKCLNRSTACRTVATAAVLLLGVALLPPPAGAAGIGGRASRTESVSTASWGATASVTSMGFDTNTSQTTNVTNTGTVALTAQSFVVTVTKPFIFAPTFQVFACAVPWSGGTCSGGAGTQIGGTLDAGTTTTITTTTALSVGAVSYLQVEPAGVFLFTTTVTISPEVTAPAQVRAALKTNQ